MAAVDGFPMIGEVRKEPEATRNIGGNWHSDHSFDALPPLGSVLMARELPDYGGDTLFASMYAAYDALSDGLKKTLGGLQRRARQDARLCRASGRPPGQRRGKSQGRRAVRRPRGRASGHAPASGKRPQGSSSSIRLIRCASKAGPSRKAGRYWIICSACGAAGIHLPLPVARRLDGLLGQSLGLALRAQRLPWLATADASHLRQGRRIWLSEGGRRFYDFGFSFQQPRTSLLMVRSGARQCDASRTIEAPAHPSRRRIQVGYSRLEQLYCRSRVNPRSVRLLRMRSNLLRAPYFPGAPFTGLNFWMRFPSKTSVV